jgi:undecaprenyl-diphosphatase
LQSLIEALIVLDKASMSLRAMLASPFWDSLTSLATQPRTWILPLSGIFVYSLKKDERRGILLALSAVILVLLVDSLATYLKSFFLRPRPHQSFIDLELLVQRPASSSFPSNHATNAFALATLISSYHRKLAAPCCDAAVLVAVSRVYLEDHYLMDVICGAVLGVASAFTFSFATRKLRERTGVATSGETSVCASSASLRGPSAIGAQPFLSSALRASRKPKNMIRGYNQKRI